MPLTGEDDLAWRCDRRSAIACEFCRYRKLKCDNVKPQCRNCNAHHKDCVYVDSVRKPRPSNARIVRLEEENRRLQDLVAQLTSLNASGSGTEAPGKDATPGTLQFATPVSDRDTEVTASNPDKGLHSCSRSSSNPHAREVLFSPEEKPRYHGPTSALFDESHIDTQHHADPSVKIKETLVPNQLLAESAKQRQLEVINFASDKLDFDGVDKELGMHLLSTYWDRQLYAGMIVYRTAFMRDMACNGPYFSKLLLNAIFFEASKHTSRLEVRRDRDDPRTAGWIYRQRAVELLAGAFDRSSITTIQALLVMTCHLFTWCDERSVSWLYARTACSMIIDLGLHVHCSRLPSGQVLSDEDAEIRRRVVWGAFYVDKIQSLYQGRPVGLREEDINIPMIFLDEYEELEQFNPASYADPSDSPICPGYTISSLREFCKLSVIMDRILGALYAGKSARKNVDTLLKEQRCIYRDLEQWRRDLPPYLSFQPGGSIVTGTLPHVLSLLATFNVLIILLHRPFVSNGHLHSITSAIATKSFLLCAAAASQIDYILRAYSHSYRTNNAPYLISYATYVSATIHVRIAAQRAPGSSAHTALRNCLDVFKEHSKICYAPRRALNVIRSLMRRMNVVVDETPVELAVVNSNDELYAGLLLRPAQDAPLLNRQVADMSVMGEVTEVPPTVAYTSTLGVQDSDLDMETIIQSFAHQPPQNSIASGQVSQAYIQTQSQDLWTVDQHTVEGFSLEQGAGMDFDSSLYGGALLEPSLGGYYESMPWLYDPLFGFDEANNGGCGNQI